MVSQMMPEGCTLCGETRHTFVARYQEPDVYEQAVGVTADDYCREWVACDACRFHYARYSRDPLILDRLYDESYRAASVSWRNKSAEEIFTQVVALPAEESETVARCTSIKQDLTQFAEDAIHTLPKSVPYRLLDVGGATGVFAYMFQDAPWTAEIVDPGKQGLFIEKHGVTYHCTRFDSAFQGGPYHLVSMIYMLEHVQDPQAVVRQAARVLAEDGLLYIEVPDVIAFEKKPLDDDIFNSCHLWMFGPTSLTNLLATSGFEPLIMRRMKTRRGHYALSVLARPT